MPINCTAAAANACERHEWLDDVDREFRAVPRRGLRELPRGRAAGPCKPSAACRVGRFHHAGRLFQLAAQSSARAMLFGA